MGVVFEQLMQTCSSPWIACEPFTFPIALIIDHSNLLFTESCGILSVLIWVNSKPTQSFSRYPCKYSWKQTHEVFLGRWPANTLAKKNSLVQISSVNKKGHGKKLRVHVISQISVCKFFAMFPPSSGSDFEQSWWNNIGWIHQVRGWLHELYVY